MLKNKKHQIISYYHENISLKKCKFILLGDSHTYGLVQYLSKSPDLVNVGINGDTTKGVLDRLSENILSIQSDIVIIQIGYNDFKYRSLAQTIANYKKILGILNEKKQLYLFSLFPVNHKRSIVNRKICLFNKELKTICNSSSKYKYVNIFDDLYDHCTKGIITDYTYDGVHLNVKGYNFYLSAIDLIIKNH